MDKISDSKAEQLNKRISVSVKEGIEVLRELEPFDVISLVENEKDPGFQVTALALLMEIIAGPILKEYSKIEEEGVDEELQKKMEENPALVMTIVKAKFSLLALSKLSTTMMTLDMDKIIKGGGIL